MADFADLTLLFSQLQSRYPGSSLTSELVQVHGDHLIVRAAVRSGSTLLATSMAAATTVEQAEDQAKVRVLSLLGITPPLPTTPSPALQPLPPLPALTFDAQSFESPAIAEPILPSPLPVLPDLPPPSAATIPREASTREETEIGEPVEPVSPNPRPNPLATRNGKPRKSVAAKAIASNDDEFETPPNTADLSDLITHIGVEMARVGWDSERGRDHILQTYSKRSRAELDETQLLEFLHFLKALPTQYE